MKQTAEKLIETGYGVAGGENAFLEGAAAAAAARRAITAHPISAVLVFASPRFDPRELLAGVASVVGDAPVFGATTAGEIGNRSLSGSVVVSILASPHLHVRVGVGRNVSRGWKRAVEEAVAPPEIRPFFNGAESGVWPELTRKGKSVFCMLFSPGNTRHADSRSFEILEELKRLSHGRIPFFGGCAAHDWNMETNHVFAGTEACADSLLVALFESRLRFGLSMGHGFSPSDSRAVATKVDGHEVLELNGCRAAEVYAKMLGACPGDLADKHLTLFSGCPAGILDVLDQYRLNVASYITPQGGVRFSQPVSENTTVTVMQARPRDLVASAKETLRKAIVHGRISRTVVALVFSCALRQRILKDDLPAEIRAMRSVVPDLPIVGFYSFGEQGLTDAGISCHGNEKITALVLGDELTASAEVAIENRRLLKLQRENERFLSAIIENIPDMIFVKDADELRFKSRQELDDLVNTIEDMLFILDGEGTIVGINRVVGRTLGYKQEALVGRSVLFVHPEDRHREVRTVMAAMMARETDTCMIPL